MIPEFYWNDNYTTILWSLGGPNTPSYTARFLGIAAAQRKVPTQTPPWLYGEPVDMARVGAQAQPIRDPGPTDNTPIAVHPPSDPMPGFPHATKGSDKGTIPAVIATYLVQWSSDLKTLGALANMAFTTAPPKRLGVG